MKWNFHCPPTRSLRTIQSNSVIHFPGVNPYAKGDKTFQKGWELFFDENIVNNIVSNTKMHIAEKKQRSTLGKGVVSQLIQYP